MHAGFKLDLKFHGCIKYSLKFRYNTALIKEIIHRKKNHIATLAISLLHVRSSCSVLIV